MFQWTEESIDWWKRAVKCNDYYEVLSKKLSHMIGEQEKVYDIGCGLGYLSMELHSYVGNITGFDIDQRVLDDFKRELEKRKIGNVQVSNERWEDLPPNSCDTLLACSFGILEEHFEQFLKLAGRQVIIIRGKKARPEELLPQGASIKADCDEEFLKKHHIVYRKETVMADFGQPLKSMEEAERFVTFYGMDQKKSIDQFLEKNLYTEEGKGGKYFLPNHKEMVIFVIDKEENQSEKGK